MQNFLSEFKLQTGYLKYRPELSRKETWEEAIRERVMKMHRDKYAHLLDNKVLSAYMDFAEDAYVDKLVLGSQRALQFGGQPILRHNSKMYNCLTSYCDRPEFFRESMWWLLSGCGVGFSVQHHHIAQLPELQVRDKGTRTFIIEDSIEGWADAIGVLLASYFRADKKFQTYWGYEVRLDYSLIRPKGAYISSGFKAPGSDPLKIAIQKIEEIIEQWLKSQGGTMRSILAYDIVMHASNAVLAGGVRRSATICIFSKDDEEMLNAKTGNWYITQPQRARSNNSVALLKSETTYEEFQSIMESVKEFGEPGFVWLDDLEILYNPCVEVGMVPKLKTEDGWVSGWQGCNLTTGNGAMCRDKKTFLRMCKALAILGTLQAGYTTFDYVGGITEEIFKKEALLGCAISGWLDNPDVLLNKETLAEGVQLIKDINKELAAILGINYAARTTLSKPDGNGAIILGSSSGVKPVEGKRWIRYVQVNPDEYGVEFFKSQNPELVEKSVWDFNGRDYAIGFAMEAEPKAMSKHDVYGVKHLEIVKFIMENWVYPGTNIEKCVIPSVRHNVSNTISVDNWEDVTDYIYANRKYFAGISLLGMSGSLEYNQAPYSEVFTPDELIKMYGDGVIMASGLIVDGLHAFDQDLWKACMYVLDRNLSLEGSREKIFYQKDWIRRAKKFAKNYFKKDLKKMTYALKDVHRYYRYMTIVKNAKMIDWSKYKEELPDYVDVNTLGAIACAGGACELPQTQLTV
jgi:ribonucleoside-diphosphate reductase alpha chain